MGITFKPGLVTGLSISNLGDCLLQVSPVATGVSVTSHDLVTPTLDDQGVLTVRGYFQKQKRLRDGSAPKSPRTVITCPPNMGIVQVLHDGVELHVEPGSRTGFSIRSDQPLIQRDMRIPLYFDAAQITALDMRDVGGCLIRVDPEVSLGCSSSSDEERLCYEFDGKGLLTITGTASRLYTGGMPLITPVPPRTEIVFPDFEGLIRMSYRNCPALSAQSGQGTEFRCQVVTIQLG